MERGICKLLYNDKETNNPNPAIVPHTNLLITNVKQLRTFQLHYCDWWNRSLIDGWWDRSTIDGAKALPRESCSGLGHTV